jgi:hypothetical protein
MMMTWREGARRAKVLCAMRARRVHLLAAGGARAMTLGRRRVEWRVAVVAVECGVMLIVVIIIVGGVVVVDTFLVGMSDRRRPFDQLRQRELLEIEFETQTTALIEMRRRLVMMMIARAAALLALTAEH